MQSHTLTFRIGGELEVSRLGYGAMRLTGQPGNFGRYPNWEEGKRLLRRALELGVNFIDTAEAYGPGTSEEIIAEALHPYPANLVIATKGGTFKESPTRFYADGSPEALRRSVENSLRRLRLATIDLYQLHRPDPAVPIEQSIEQLARMREEGKIRFIGVSNVDRELLTRAISVTPIASVQNRYNSAKNEDDLVDFTAESGMAFLPWSPLGAEPFEREAPLARGVASEGATPAQRALAWLLTRSPNILPIPGTTSIAHLEENMGAAELVRDAD